jgi:hypothetical protein
MRVQLLMTHEDTSQLIDTSRETVTRLLKEFRTRKIISIKGSALTVHDKASRVLHVAAIVVEQTDEGADAALDIAGTSGEHTSIRFRSPMLPELLDENME